MFSSRSEITPAHLVNVFILYLTSSRLEMEIKTSLHLVYEVFGPIPLMTAVRIPSSFFFFSRLSNYRFGAVRKRRSSHAEVPLATDFHQPQSHILRTRNAASRRIASGKKTNPVALHFYSFKYRASRSLPITAHKKPAHRPRMGVAVWMRYIDMLKCIEVTLV